MKLILRQDNGEVLGAHIYGLHAADLIQEVANSISRRQNVFDILVDYLHSMYLTISSFSFFTLLDFSLLMFTIKRGKTKETRLKGL